MGDAGGNVDLWVDQDPQVTPDPTYTIARSRLTTPGTFRVAGP